MNAMRQALGCQTVKKSKTEEKPPAPTVAAASTPLAGFSELDKKQNEEEAVKFWSEEAKDAYQDWKKESDPRKAEKKEKVWEGANEERDRLSAQIQAEIAAGMFSRLQPLTELDDLGALATLLDQVCTKTPLDIEEYVQLDIEERRQVAAQLLGDFYNPEHDWVVNQDSTGWTIDMVLQPSLIGSRRPLATRLLRDLQDGVNRHNLVIGLSGGGKTSAVVDVAAEHYILYFQCNDETPGREINSKWFDDGFAQLVRQFRADLGTVEASAPALSAAILTEDQKKLERYGRARDIARRLALVEFLARLCQLWQFVRERPNATSGDFFAFQRARGHTWITHFQARLSKLSDSSCVSLITQLCEDLYKRQKLTSARKLVVVIDEIQQGFALQSDKFFDGATRSRGILHLIISTLASLPVIHFIYMGTGVSFDCEPALVSAIGKNVKMNYVNRFETSEQDEMFPTVNEDTCQRFFRMLNVSDVLDVDHILAVPLKRPRAELMTILRTVKGDGEVDVDDSFALQVINHLVVGSRFQTLARVLPSLRSAAKELPTKSKRARFNYAVSTAVLGMTKDLVNNFRNVASDKAVNATTLLYNELLLTVWTATVLSEGQTRFYRKNISEDLIHLGLAFGYGDLSPTDEYTETTGWYKVTEPIAVVALQEYFERSEFGALNNQFAHVVNGMATLLERHGLNASRGTLFEDIVLAAFRRERFQQQLVADLPFVKIPLEEAQAYTASLRRSSLFAAPPSVTADPWWTKTTFQVTSVVREDAQGEQLGLNTAEILSTRPHVLVSPETTARFDGMVMLGPKEAVTLAITIWAQEVPPDKVESQILSTDPALAYYLTNGKEVNKSCLERRNLWEAKGLNQVRAVRIHVALPESVPRRYATIEGDSLLVHLDMHNIHLLFGNEMPELYDILAVATRTKRESWGDPAE